MLFSVVGLDIMFTVVMMVHEYYVVVMKVVMVEDKFDGGRKGNAGVGNSGVDGDDSDGGSDVVGNDSVSINDGGMLLVVVMEV